MYDEHSERHQEIIIDNLSTAASWNRSSETWYKDIDIYVKQIIEKPEIAFPSSVFKLLQETFPSFEGINVCVPSSGDNTAVYAFHLLGAKVTSVDLSEKQIEKAFETAEKFNWKINFICDDSTFLNKLQDDTFDLVYTSNGVHVWIPDLPLMYKNFNRILKSGGQFVFFDSHPFSRPFDDSGSEIKIVKEYLNTTVINNNGVKRYEWKVKDYINSLVASNFEIIRMIEFNSTKDDFIKYDYMYKSVEERVEDKYRKYNWLENPWAALPQCMGMSVRKK